MVMRTDKAGEKKLASKLADLVGRPLGQVPSSFSDGAAFHAEVGELDGGRLKLDERCSLEDDSQRSLPVRQISCGGPNATSTESSSVGMSAGDQPAGW
jgi:hypothetical protein